MDRIDFQLIPGGPDDFEDRVAIDVNDISLLELVRGAESRFALSSGELKPTIAYRWVPARFTVLPAEHFLGRDTLGWWEDAVPVLVCSCGEWACTAIVVQIKVLSNRVIWRAWRDRSDRENARALESLGPCLFERLQYESALKRVSEQYRLRV